MGPITSVSTASPSLFHTVKIAQWVGVPPAALAAPLPAVCASVLSPLLLSYYAPAGGIVLGWEDVEVSEEAPARESGSTAHAMATSKKGSSKAKKAAKAAKAQEAGDDSSSSSGESSDSDEDEQEERHVMLRHIDEYASPFVWATATLLVLRPVKNASITARITHQDATHITLSYLNAFAVSVVHAFLPPDWTWTAAAGYDSVTGKTMEGYWVDGEGAPVEDTLEVRIRDWDARSEGRWSARGFLRIEGSLVDEEGEKAEKRKGKKGKSALKAGSAETGADAMEID